MTESNNNQMASTEVPERTVAKTTSERCSTSEMTLWQWASVPGEKFSDLANRALTEKWYYGDETEENKKKLPILRNYLNYTFRRLVVEDKVVYGSRGDKEYAAFNTGLVDKTYEDIYALFEKKHYKGWEQDWYLLDFVVAGEDLGKILVAVFNPLPKRADYFEGKIENMLYDVSTGECRLDGKHLIIENADRFPKDFFEENCPTGFLCVNDINIDDVYDKDVNDQARKAYFNALGRKILDNSRVHTRLKNQIENAAKLALKRVQWNYKTAIPIYYVKGQTCALMLPLCLMQDDRVDLALVVKRQESGNYQGETVLMLKEAYMNSRLITRPDSDWLKTETIAADSADELDDND